jgi:hypothetical protein
MSGIGAQTNRKTTTIKKAGEIAQQQNGLLAMPTVGMEEWLYYAFIKPGLKWAWIKQNQTFTWYKKHGDIKSCR